MQFLVNSGRALFGTHVAVGTTTPRPRATQERRAARRRELTALQPAQIARWTRACFVARKHCQKNPLTLTLREA